MCTSFLLRDRSRTKFLFAGLAGLFVGGMLLSQAAPVQAGQVAPPPLVLSPNLAEPWMLQLQPNRQRAVRRPVDPRRTGAWYQRQRVQQPQRINRPAQVQPASVRNPAPQQRRQIAPQFLPTIVDYRGPHKAGTIIINTNEKYLYLVQKDGTARRYGVGVGKPGFEWAGTHKVTRKAEWPDWRPPAAMRKRRPDLPNFMPGGPENPLGARALYLGSTLYRIHGSNQPWTIGHAVSSGCIRMRNEDVSDLYERVGVGTTVHVI
ncbi:ErfK/YbiS/YcfS/YnhG [Roseibium sp. TrichSKD4]|uniref:L,D-transpeptidase n=1 Tax=Roseibium sp. TrichSKD4 TaxID=744980 RepID=UPI0001E56304|nr:ErfK/YbiS/YcfS/YnhG [Roseibium sp. TrichSKD4]